jgi:hypothetical protein
MMTTELIIRDYADEIKAYLPSHFVETYKKDATGKTIKPWKQNIQQNLQALQHIKVLQNIRCISSQKQKLAKTTFRTT